MKTYKIKIVTPGYMITFKGKRVRTPVIFENIKENEINLIKIQAKRSLLKYEVLEEGPAIKVESIVDVVENKLDECIIIEEIKEDKEPTTILEKLLFESKNN